MYYYSSPFTSPLRVRVTDCLSVSDLALYRKGEH